MTKTTTRAIPKRGRQLHLPDGIWQFRIGRGGIRLWDPLGNSYTVRMTDFTGWSPTDLERGRWKGYAPKIGPADVKEYIETHDLYAGTGSQKRAERL